MTFLTILTFILCYIFEVAIDGISVTAYTDILAYYFSDDAYYFLDVADNFLRVAFILQTLLFALVRLFCFLLAFVGSRGWRKVMPGDHMVTKTSVHSQDVGFKGIGRSASTNGTAPATSRQCPWSSPIRRS